MAEENPSDEVVLKESTQLPESVNVNLDPLVIKVGVPNSWFAKEVCAPSPNEQDNWRLCGKCQGLVYGGNPSPGACSAGGLHDCSGSRNYALAHDVPVSGSSQDQWHWCSKCQGLAYDGSSQKGVCPDGGTHALGISLNYVLSHDIPNAGQDNLRWCNKCFGLFFADGKIPGACPAGGTHNLTISFNYCIEKA